MLLFWYFLGGIFADPLRRQCSLIHHIVVFSARLDSLKLLLFVEVLGPLLLPANLRF